MAKYYEAYDKRYRQVHEKSLSWETDTNSPIVLEALQKYVKTAHPKILDVGCGEGRDCFFLLNRGLDVYAIDVSEEAVKYCQRKAKPQDVDRFRVLDVCTGCLEDKFDFIYSVATLHMLVLQQDRERFLSFIKNHLTDMGYALILSLGDGRREHESDVSEAFLDVKRTHQGTGEEMLIASTSCKVVSFETFRRELRDSGFEIVEEGITSIENHFSSIMYAVVR